jgi:hypothetical protein
MKTSSRVAADTGEIEEMLSDSLGRNNNYHAYMGEHAKSGFAEKVMQLRRNDCAGW